MARPVKKGISYFSLDTDILSDRKVRRIIRQFGAESLSVLITILCYIYGGEGYYILYDDDLIFDTADVLNMDENKIRNIISKAIEVDFFNKNKYEKHKIFTSARIQKNYLEATKKRVNISINSLFDCITVPETNEQVEFPEKKPKDKKVSGCKSTQSKVKKSKVKESKENKNIYTCTLADSNAMTNVEIDELLKTYSTVNVKCAEFVTLKLQEYKKLVDEYSESFVLQCITKLDNYKGSKGVKYDSDYRTMLNWVIDAVKKDMGKKVMNDGRNDGKHQGDVASHSGESKGKCEGERLARRAMGYNITEVEECSF